MAAFCQKFLVNDANRRGERRKEETKKMEDWCVGADAYIGPPPPHSESNASGGALSFCGERKGGKNAVKTKVLKSFPRLRCRSSRPFLPRELE